MADVKFNCDLCNIFNLDKTTLKSHMQGSKHTRLAREKAEKERKEKFGIYVIGISQSIKKEDLVNYFSTFGKINHCFVESQNKYAIFEFDNLDCVNSLLSRKTLKFQNSFLIVKPRKINVQTNNNDNNRNSIFLNDINCIDNIVKNLQNQSNFDIQLNHIIYQLRVAPEIINRAHNIICADLQNCLWTRFPGCRIWFFGSTTSGLAFKTSDIDIYVEIAAPIEINSSEPLPSVCTKITRNVLRKTNLFTKIVAIANANTPIVKFVHKPTRLCCDVNFKNMLGVCNSNLIRFLISLDKRILPFMFIVKLWGKIQNISGTGKIPNYGIIMLVIFYLQQSPNAILPPITLLQSNEYDHYYEGWNGGFCAHPDIVPHNQNKLAITELLKGFFNFWAKFDYGLYVICPLTSKIQTKINFANPENLPKQFFHYKNMISQVKPLNIGKPLTIQDPFHLTHNVTSNVSARQLEDFKKLCEIAAEIFSDLSDVNKKHLLPKLFTKVEPKLSYEVNNEKCIFKISGNTISVLENYFIIKKDIKVVQQLWLNHVLQFIDKILKQVFMLDVTVKKDSQKSKLPKLNGQTDIHDTSILDATIFHCMGYYNLWEVRRSFLKDIQESVKDKKTLEKEIALSELIVQKSATKETVPIVNFDLILHYKLNPIEAEIELKNVKSLKNNFKIMANYLAIDIPVWFLQYLRDENEKILTGASVAKNKSENLNNTSQINKHVNGEDDVQIIEIIEKKSDTVNFKNRNVIKKKTSDEINTVSDDLIIIDCSNDVIVIDD